MNAILSLKRWLAVVFLFSTCNTSHAATPDIFDTSNISGLRCEGQGIAAFADIDGDGTFNTLVIINTVAGASEIYPDAQQPGNELLFYASDANCPGNQPGADKARLSIRFVDRSAPGHDDYQPATYTYKSISAVEITGITGSVVTSGTQLNPYMQIAAYRNLLVNNAVPDLIDSGNIPVYNFASFMFSDPAGVMELRVTSDFAENFLDDFILHDSVNADSASVAILLDTSGSMNWGVDGGYSVPAAEKRITLARNALEPFLYLMEDYGSNQVDFGLVAFPDFNNSPGCSGWEARPLDVVTPTAVDQTINSVLPGLPIMGSTPLLGGIASAGNMLSNASGNKSIVLLSDGYHNCPYAVASDGPEVAAVVNQLNSTDVKLHAIGFGLPSDVDSSMLQSLSQGTSGEYYSVTSSDVSDPSSNAGVELQETYKNIAVQSLGLQGIVDPISEIKPYSRKRHRVKVSPYDEKITFYVSWENCEAAEMKVSLLDGNGKPVPLNEKGIVSRNAHSYWMTTLEGKALSSRQGKQHWTLNISAGRSCDQHPLIYQYSVVGHSALELTPSILAESFQPGETLLLMARLSARQEPYVDAVQAQVEVVMPAAYESGPQKRLTLELYDDGRHGDSQAKDGIYTTVLENTGLAGTYTFNFKFESEAKSDRPFERYMRLTKSLKPLVWKGEK